MKVLFFSKSKLTTQATEHMMTALRRHPEITTAKRVNHKKQEKLFGRRIADRLIRARIRRFRPDITLINNRDIRPEWIDLCGRYGATACVYHEMVPQPPEAQVAVARLVDSLYLAGEKDIAQFQQAGAKHVRMLLRGCSRDNHYRITKPVPPRWHSDVSFIGKPRQGVRQQLIDAVAGHCRLKLWGSGWAGVGLHSEMNRAGAAEYRKICAGTKIMLGLNCGGGKTWEQIRAFTKYTSNRTRVTLGCGGFVLTNYNEGLEEVFTPGVHLDFYRDIEECLTKIDYYLSHPEERERIALQGNAFVQDNMTFDHFIEEVVKDAHSLVSTDGR